MLDVQELEVKTAQLFSDPLSLKVPEPPSMYKEQIEIFKEQNIDNQLRATIFDMRCWQASALGLVKVSEQDICKLLFDNEYTHMNEPLGATPEGEKEMLLGTCFNHMTGEVEIDQRRVLPWRMSRWAKENAWYLPPFRKQCKWVCVGGPLNYLTQPVPYGIALRMKELFDLKLINCFMAFAPEEAFQSADQVDPIVVARISEFAFNREEEKTQLRAGRQSFYFIGRWGL